MIILSGFGIKEKELTTLKENIHFNNISKLERPIKIGTANLTPSEVDRINNTKTLLAEQLKIPAREITLISYERILWEDSSLGCPQLGQLYSQAIVPGLKMTLEANGEEYDYHANMSQVFFYCSN
mgnify:CR=1 FL=1